MASKKFNLYKEDLTANITNYSEKLSTNDVDLVALFSIYTGIVPEYAAEILGTLAGHDHSEEENDHCLAKALHYLPAGQLRKSGNTKGEANETKKDDYKAIIDGIIDLIGGVKTKATKTLVQEVTEKLGLEDAAADLDKDGVVDGDDVKIAKAIVSTVEFEEEAEEAEGDESDDETPAEGE